VDAMEAAELAAALDSARSQTELQQLPPPDNAVLAIGELGDPMINKGGDPTWATF
jgi:hypothetical protein